MKITDGERVEILLKKKETFQNLICQIEELVKDVDTEWYVEKALRKLLNEAYRQRVSYNDAIGELISSD